MSSGNGNARGETLEIMNEDKFFSRLLSKENARLESSSRVYHYYCGAPGSVPFLWESRPGTPKHTLFSHHSTNQIYSTPPLTPPPSYHSNSINTQKFNSNKTRKILLSNVFRKKNSHTSPSFSWSSTASSSSSSSSSSFSSLSKKNANRRVMYYSYSRSHGGLGGNGEDDDDDVAAYEEEEEMWSSPRSILCFGGSQRSGLKSRRGSGLISMVNVKIKAFVSIIGHRRGIKGSKD